MYIVVASSIIHKIININIFFVGATKSTLALRLSRQQIDPLQLRNYPFRRNENHRHYRDVPNRPRNRPFPSTPPPRRLNAADCTHAKTKSKQITPKSSFKNQPSLREHQGIDDVSFPPTLRLQRFPFLEQFAHIRDLYPSFARELQPKSAKFMDPGEMGKKKKKEYRRSPLAVSS